MITPSFSPTATERVLPKLALDFTTASLDPRVTFTRAGNTATVVNSSGTIQTVNANLPRFDYNPVTLACKGLLIEESRVNNITYTQDFSQYNAIVGAGINATAATAPDGTNTFGLLTEDTSTGSHYIQKRINVLPAATYTWSVFVKLNGSRRFALYETNANGSYVVFDLTTASIISNTSGQTATITSYGNSVYRVSMTYVTGGSFANVYRYVILPANATTATTTYQGDGTSGVYLWGDQVETGAFPTSYIPNLTTGTTTRNADVATMTGTNFSDWYNQSQGSLYAEITGFPTVSTGRNGVVTMEGASTQSSIAMGRSYAGGTVNVLYGGCFDTNVTQAYIAGATVVANTPYKMCMAYKANSFAISVNGAAVVQDTSGTVPSLTNMEIGCYAGAYFVNSCVKKVMFYIQRLTNAEVQAFTK